MKSERGMNRRRPVSFLLVAAALLSGCTGMMLGGGGSAGRPIGQDTRSSQALASDQRITAIIRNRIAIDAELDGQELSVETMRGVVTLRGAVDEYALRERAARLARDVDGVLRVSNQIALRR